MSEIKGYRELSAGEIAAINQLKEAEEGLFRIICEVDCLHSMDGRWRAVGTTHIEQGFMALIRSITKPSRIESQ